MPKQKSDPSFWKSSAPPEKWEELVQYMRPRKTEELTEFFAPKMQENQPPEKSQKKTLLEQLGLAQEEFVELALQQPELWNEQELDYLHEVASEGLVDERLEELAYEYFTGGTIKKKQETSRAPTKQTDVGVNELPTLPGVGSIPDLDALPGTVTVDKWWEKVSKK